MRAFVRQQQVWAKVDPFPWWPAKILAIHRHHHAQVFKVRFYNDSTYAYLTQESLRHFQTHTRPNPEHMQLDPRLAKAVRIADQAFSRTASVGRTHSELSPEHENTEAKTEEKGMLCPEAIIPPIISNQKSQLPHGAHAELTTLPETHQKEHKRSEETAFSPIHQPNEQILRLEAVLEEVTKENIIDFLQGRRREERFEYDYDSRKKTILQTGALKLKLLERYSLHDLPEQRENTRQNTQETRYRRDRNGRRRPVHKKKTITHSTPHLEQKCIKKLYRTLKGSASCLANLKQTSVNLMAKITRISEGNQLRLRTLFIALIKSLQTPSHITLPDRMAAFTGYLDRLQSQRPEDEEGSKMTQVSQGQGQ